MKATLNDGSLQPIPNCEILIPGGNPIKMYILPDITDTKGASYSDEPIIGRAFPIKTYSHSENRAITMKVHFVTLKATDAIRVLSEVRLIQSAVYPRDGSISPGGGPYLPPPVCKIRCGRLLAGGNDGSLCVVLKNYSVSYPPDVAWHTIAAVECLPYKFTMDLTWDVVYANENLPGQENIMKDF